jgi:hypothetical protein
LLAVAVALLLGVYVYVNLKVIQHPPFTYSLWSTSFALAINGLLVGLIISSLAANQSRLYVAIPIVLILHLLFGGGLTLNKSYVFNKSFVQNITNLTPIRWATEAVVVKSVIQNEYYAQLYPIEFQIKQCDYFLETGIPGIVGMLDKEIIDENDLNEIIRELNIIERGFMVFPFEFKEFFRE